MTFLSGAKYDGEWLYDKMHGVGIMKFPDGAELQGVWCENEPQGCGVFTWPNGARQYHDNRHGNAVAITGPNCDSVNSIVTAVLAENQIDKLQLESEIRHLLRKLKKEEHKMRLEIGKLQKEDQQRMSCLKEKHVKQLKTLNEEYQAERDQLERKFIKEKSEVVVALTEEVQSAMKREKALQKELEEEKESKLCQICFDEERNSVLIPCLHFLYCRQCVNKYRDEMKNGAECPACKTLITGQLDCKLGL